MTNKEILIVEDDKSLTFIYEQLLKGHGFSSHIVYDGEQALTYLEKHHPDIILLDMHVPYASGGDILRHMQTHPHSQKANIILASADSALCHAWKDQVSKIFIKPFNLSELIKAIKALSAEQQVA